MSHKKIIRAVTVSQSVVFFRDIIPTLNAKGYDVIALSSPGKEMEELKEQGVQTIEIEMERHIAIHKDLKALINIIKALRAEKPEIIHSMTPKAGLLCMISAWITRVPVRVHTFTGLVWPTATGIQRRILMLTDWLTCACATHVIPEGKGVMEDLQKHITHKPMRVLGFGNARGVDMEFWKKENASAEQVEALSDKNKFTFLFVGRIVRDKGINELVEAFMHVRERHSVRLILVGRFEETLDPVSDNTRQKIEECEDIIYVGPQYGKDLLAYYTSADCFAFPSYREGFPNTVLEAGAMGLPSIVTDINGSREIIENGKNGIIIQPKDSRALANAMEIMISDTAMCQQMANNARPMIASRFEQNFVRKCQMDFYDEVMQQHHDR